MADRYWVGGAGAWNSSTTHWAATSGGAAGASVPTAADNVFFDQAGTYTVTMSVVPSQKCANLTVSAGTVTFLGIDTGTSATSFTISGSLSLIAGTVWNFSAGSSQTVSFTSTTAQTVTTNGVTLQGPHYFNGVAGTFQLQDAATFSSNVVLQNGTLDLNGKTLTAPSMTTSGSGAKGIAFGAGNITLTGSGTLWSFSPTNLTITGTPTVNLTYTGTVARTLSPGAGTESQVVNFNILGGTGAFNLTTGAYGSLDFTGYAGNITAGTNASFTFYGSLTLSSGMSMGFLSSNSSTFAGTSGTKNLTFNGKTLNTATGITFNGAGATWRLQDTVAFSVGITFTNGTIDLNGQQMTVPSVTTAVGTKNITFNGGTITCTGTGSTWNNAQPTGFTTTAGTGTGTIALNNASAKTFAGGGSIYNCNLSNTGAGALTITGSNTLRSLASSTTARTYTFTAGTTTTFTALGFTGAAANLITLGSSSTATYTISQSSGTVSCDYLSVSRSVASGGAAFYAGANSTNGGTNIGWSFTAAPAVGTSLNNFFFMF